MIAAAVFFIVIFTIMWLGIVIGVSASTPFLAKFFPGQEFQFVFGMLNLLFTVGIPILGVIFLIFRLVFARRIGKGWTVALTILWFLNIFSLAAIGSNLAQEFNSEEQVSANITPANFVADTLQLGFASENFNADGVTMRIGGEMVELPGAEVRYKLIPSKDDEWRLTQIAQSRGRNSEEARELAANLQTPVNWNPTLELLTVPAEIPFDALDKWRVQEVLLELAIPVGSYVKMDQAVYYRTKLRGDHSPQDGIRLYRMEESGQLVCKNCRQRSTQTPTPPTPPTAPTAPGDSRSATFSGYDALSISGPLKVTIEAGDEFEFRSSGDTRYLEQLEMEQDGEVLNIDLPLDKTGSPVYLYITMPTLRTMTLAQTDDVRIKRMRTEQLDVTAAGDFELKVDVISDEVKLIGSEGVEIEFVGTTRDLITQLTGKSRLDTDRGQVSQIDMTASAGSRIKIHETTAISSRELSDDSKLRVVD